jgi:hypothetical protein
MPGYRDRSIHIEIVNIKRKHKRTK